MKVIPVVGYSGSGKTRFIEELIPALNSRGEVAVIKHLGEHRYYLEEGKDTTRFFERGAVITAGVDDQKTVLTVRDYHLDRALGMLSDAGIQFAIIEGFKSAPYPKIVIGDLVIEGCVLRNPTTLEVIDSLSRFEEYVTMEGIVKDLKRGADISRAGAVLTFNGVVRQWTDGERTEYMEFDERIENNIRTLTHSMESIPGILGVRFHHRKGRLLAGEPITFIAVLAEHRREALTALSDALDELKREVHDGEKGRR